MPPEHLFRFGEGAGETLLHPIVLVAMLIAVALTLLLPRKYVAVPLLAITFLVPIGQQLLIGGLHFFVYRIILLVGSLRILYTLFSSPGSAFGRPLDMLDKVFVLWAILRAAAVILLFSQAGAVINQMGFLLDAFGGYFMLRYSIQDDEDFHRAIRTFAVIVFIIGGCMLFEKFSMVNVFGLLGGVHSEPDVRLGSVRAQGPFQHSVLAGTFAATLIPLFYLLWKSGKSRALAVIGAVGATAMTVTAASSTPLLAYAGAVLAICCWPLRRVMRPVRWGFVAALVGLHLVMKAPVWFLIQRVDIVGGSSGYHRARLVNDFIMHFRDWWLLGTTDNPKWGFTMWDLANQYVLEGETGGLAAFICFIAIICICFSRIGRARQAVDGDRDKEWYFWLLGCALFSHLVAYFGISYFDQTRFAWFALLTLISAATAPFLMKVPAPSPVRGSTLRSPSPAYAPITKVGATNLASLSPQTSFRSRYFKSRLSSTY